MEAGEEEVAVVFEEEPLDLAISCDMSEAKSIFADWVARWRVKRGGVFGYGVMKAVDWIVRSGWRVDVVKSRRGQGLGRILADGEVLGADGDGRR